MQHSIAVLQMQLIGSALKPTPTPRTLPSPVPTATIRYVPIDAGSGLNGVFIILLVLLLAGLAGWVIWMFGTGRWLSLKAGEAYAASENTRPKRVPGSQASLPIPDILRKRGNAGVNAGPVAAGQGSSQVDDQAGNQRWVELAEGCAALYEELDGRYPPSDARYEVANRALHRLQVVLRRSGVEVIARDHVYDPTRHQLVPPDPAVPSGAPIARIVSPGFAIGGNILRQAKVEVARPVGSAGQAEQVERADLEP